MPSSLSHTYRRSLSSSTTSTLSTNKAMTAKFFNPESSFFPSTPRRIESITLRFSSVISDPGGGLRNVDRNAGDNASHWRRTSWFHSWRVGGCKSPTLRSVKLVYDESGRCDRTAEGDNTVYGNMRLSGSRSPIFGASQAGICSSSMIFA